MALIKTADEILKTQPHYNKERLIVAWYRISTQVISKPTQTFLCSKVLFFSFFFLVYSFISFYACMDSCNHHHGQDPEKYSYLEEYL